MISKKLLKRVSGLAISVSMILGMATTVSATPEQTSDYLSEASLLTAAGPAINAYAEHYNISDMDILSISVSDGDNGAHFVEFYLELEAVLKYENATELPQIRGLSSTFGIDSKEFTTEEFVQILSSSETLTKIAESVLDRADTLVRSLDENEVSTLSLLSSADDAGETAANVKEDIATAISYLVIDETANFVQSIEDEYIGNTNTFNLGFLVEYDDEGNQVKVQYATLDDFVDNMSLVVPNSVSTMEALGAQQADDMAVAAVDYLEKNAGGVSPLANTSFTYYRANAAAYANTYTSSPNSHYCATHDCNIRQDTSKYNSAYSWYCCNDCANYVSQAMAFGNVPEDTTWKPGSDAWINCAKMKTYFTTTKQWWETSNFTSCNAGGVIMLHNSSGNPYHVVMCVKNDTVTRAFSGHTNDRLEFPYSSSDAFGAASVNYYRFSNVYPNH